MKKLIIAILVAGIGLAFYTHPILAKTYPSPQGHVSDFANIISDPIKLDLEETLSTYEASSSHEIAVVTLESLDNDVIENVAVSIFEQWGIGKKDQDNGVLLLIAPNDRELKIEVGYGLEPILTDSRAGTIIREKITPEFKKDDYNAGIVNGVNAIITVLDKDPTAFDNITPTPEFDADKLDSLIFLGIMLIYLSSFLARSKRWWPGGVIGAVIGLIFISLAGAVALGILGLLLDFLLSKNYKKLKKRGLSTSWLHSMGGFSSGKSSGGFGGFGGGRSGGGGASGSW